MACRITQTSPPAILENTHLSLNLRFFQQLTSRKKLFLLPSFYLQGFSLATPSVLGNPSPSPLPPDALTVCLSSLTISWWEQGHILSLVQETHVGRCLVPPRMSPTHPPKQGTRVTLGFPVPHSSRPTCHHIPTVASFYLSELPLPRLLAYHRFSCGLLQQPHGFHPRTFARAAPKPWRAVCNSPAWPRQPCDFQPTVHHPLKLPDPPARPLPCPL